MGFCTKTRTSLHIPSSTSFPALFPQKMGGALSQRFGHRATHFLREKPWGRGSTILTPRSKTEVLTDSSLCFQD